MSRSSASFEKFCQVTSLHGWKFLSAKQSSKPLRFGWILVVLASLAVTIFFLMYSILNFWGSTVQTTQDTSRGSLRNVYFPSVTLCNINQGRSSLFRQYGLGSNESLLHAVLEQAYFGIRDGTASREMEDIRRIFGDEDLVKKGVLADTMFMMTPYRSEAYELAKKDDWAKLMNVTYVTDSGWYFKTQAVQEIGENVVLRATYQRTEKNIEKFTSLLPFFGTDYGLCTLIKPQITFNSSLEGVPFNDLIQNYSRIITPGIRLGKENGLSFLVDAEVYDYGFSPQRGEGFKLAIHHHMDQPIMALSDVDISPGFVTQLSVTPTLTVTTEEAKRRFTPDERVCYFDEEFKFKYLPDQMYRYGLSNCLFAATYDTILSRCKCVPFFHTIAYADYPQICSGKSLYCMNTILSDIGSHTHVRDINGIIRPCYSPCQDQRNKLAVTTSVFPNQNTFASSSSNGEFCAVLKKIRSTCRTDKKVTLSERYPGICKLVTKYGAALCHNEMDEYYHGTLGEYGYREKNSLMKNKTQIVYFIIVLIRNKISLYIYILIEMYIL
nr:uncharacterized protein LOC121113868 [Lepeophtheirus salmonis]